MRVWTCQSPRSNLSIIHSFVRKQSNIFLQYMRINFVHSLLILAWLTAVAVASADYNKYHEQWQKVVPPNFVINATNYATKQQLCGQVPCEFYFYLYENAELAKESSRNRTVLLISGLQGDDSLGPDLLFNSYGKITAARIIFFPLANPSGYMQGTQTTFPKQADVLLDFPINNNQKCNKTSAFKILQHLYLKYPIDLSVYVHEGSSAISYPWTKQYNDKNIHQTQEHELYEDISDMLRSYDLQKNVSQQLQQLTPKADQQVDNSGNLVDWVYGASHYPDILSKSCDGKTITKYPSDTMNGLVYSVGLGTTNRSRDSQQQIDTRLQRGLTLVIKLISLVNPQVVIMEKGSRVAVYIEGCKMSFLSFLKIVDTEGKTVLQKTDETIVRGDVTGQLISPSFFQTDVQLPPSSNIKYEAKFKCGSGWIGQGRTAFSKMREFTSSGQVNTTQGTQILFEQTPIPWQTYQMLLAAILITAAIVWGINCVRIGMKVRRARKLCEFNERFEQIEYIEDVEAYEDSLSSKGPEALEDSCNLKE